MANVVIHLIPGAVPKLLKGTPIQGDLARRGAQIAAGHDGFVVFSSVGAQRARVAIVAATNEARVAEAEDGTLTKSLDAGRQ